MFDGLFQPIHLVFILLIALLIFGPGKLPELGGALGKTVRAFKKSINETTDELRESVNDIKEPVEQIRRLPAEMKSDITLTGTATAVAAKVCAKCSAENPSTGKFCGECGAPLA